MKQKARRRLERRRRMEQADNRKVNEQKLARYREFGARRTVQPVSETIPVPCSKAMSPLATIVLGDGSPLVLTPFERLFR